MTPQRPQARTRMRTAFRIGDKYQKLTAQATSARLIQSLKNSLTPASPKMMRRLLICLLSGHNTKAYHILSKIAFDLLSIPAMSLECECIFSQAKQQITDDRNHLGVVTVEAE
jgi:hypothetical protein